MTDTAKQRPGGLPAGRVQARPSHDHITQKLREFYDQVQDEAIPDKFLDLLERLDEAERKAADAKS